MRPEANVVITGAAHGIGAALAGRFAADGHRVALLDRDVAAAGDRSRALERAGARSLAVDCDVTDPGACRDAVDRVCAAWGGIDVLVNNAGLTQLGTVRETDVAVLRRVMDVNFFGAVQMTQAALATLLERRGSVAALSSVAGFAPLATRAGYVASKHALQGFFETLRTEHAEDGLGVTIVCPSFVRTHIGERALGVHEGAPSAQRTGVAHELDPAAAADLIYRGIDGRRRVVWVGREARLAWWAWQLWPRLYERRMLRRTGGSAG